MDASFDYVRRILPATETTFLVPTGASSMLVAFDGTPLVIVGGIQRDGLPGTTTSNTILMDATNEAIIMCGQIFTSDGASHTIDTTGSSSLGWRTGAVTLQAGTVVSVGLAAVDTGTGPPGRAANVADVITFDVSAVFTTTGVTANAWQESVPTVGTKTIANGDFLAFAVQMTTAVGADLVNATVAGSAGGGTPARPFVTSFTGGSYTAATRLPNAVITFSDGAFGFFFDGAVCSVASTTQTWNSGSATKEYGNFLQMPMPAKIYGLAGAMNFSADCDWVLYSDPLGTPVAEKTISFDANAVGVANNIAFALFPAPYTTTANQPLAAIFKPGGSNVGSNYLTLNNSDHQKSMTLGTNCYAVNRAAGSFAAQNSNKDRFSIGLLVGAFNT